MTGNETPKDENRIVKGGDLPGAQPVDKAKPTDKNIEHTLETPQTKSVSDLDEYNNAVYRRIEECVKNGKSAKAIKNLEENKELIEPFLSAIIQTKKIRVSQAWYVAELEVVDGLEPDIFSQIVNAQKKNMSEYTLYGLNQIQKYTTDNGNIQIRNNPLLHQIMEQITERTQGVYIPNDPYCLLLPLTHQERAYIIPIFNVAQEQKMYPFTEMDYKRNYTSATFPTEPTIFRTTDLFKIGMQLKIEELGVYINELEKIHKTFENAQEK